MKGMADWASGTIGYTFRDASLLDLALTHRSAAAAHNERLEFLGDAVLGMVAAEVLYASWPAADEGVLSKLRARLVRRETLEQIARSIDLGRHIKLGSGETRSGGHQRGSILANALEAVIGAVFLDGGVTPARELVLRLLSAHLAGLAIDEDLRDPKTRLQEFLQAQGEALPVYTVEQISGSAHDQLFEVVCRLDGLGLSVRGKGSSRRLAEQRAAEQALREADRRG
ncbi:MAG: ribonuclease III [Gammaproteobacteria bacterium]|nr:ribonuclease III [Gammaproteobacteria bacterium]